MPTPQDGRRQVEPTAWRRPGAVEGGYEAHGGPSRERQAGCQEEASHHPGGTDETDHPDGDWVRFLADSGMLPSRSFLILSLV